VWDERSSHTHGKALKNSAVPREPETEKERETEKEEEKVYTESEIASIQIDAIKHAAVADAASARLDLEWETKKFAPTPRVEPVPTQVEPTTDSSESNDSTNKHATGTTLPPCAVPTDTNAKASLGRYKYDIDATQSGGEPLCVVESYDPVEVAKIGDTPGAQLGDLLPETVRKACRYVLYFPNPNTVCPYKSDTFLLKKKWQRLRVRKHRADAGLRLELVQDVR
jgi:hypothetical protein